ncbi:spore coat protein [Alicyclobacillus acidiphilus]|jgi:spore coat protein X|uniref:spore coat protein n=1 Tax=Alicyclobacillus acidiphilus TaxID=182455 RepID=UPI0008336593|nr:spore coat protein [Alicyclobacillus acidiphilus]
MSRKYPTRHIATKRKLNRKHTGSAIRHRSNRIATSTMDYDYDLDKFPSESEASSQIVELAEQSVYDDQASYVTVIVKDSAEVQVETADFQAALALQLTLQLALALILSVAIADDATYTRVVNDIVSRIQEVQLLRRVIRIEGSYNVRVRVLATELAFNLQLLLQLMATIVAQLEVA